MTNLVNTKLAAFLTAITFLFVACSGSPKDINSTAKVTRVLLKKSERKLTLLAGQTELKSYRVSLGKNPVGPKSKQGDNKTPGGDIMIHGIKNGMGWIGSFHRWVDWTQGCIAVTNEEIEEIYALVSDGTPIEIQP